MAKAQAKKTNSKSILITVCVILAVLLVVGLTVLNQMKNKGTLQRSQTAASSDNFKVSGTMMNYFFQNQYQNMYQYFEYLGVDTSKSLKDQACPLTENGSWFDYIANSAKKAVTETLALCEAAKANGVELEADDRALIDNSLNSLGEAAAQYGYTKDAYIQAAFGAGTNEKDLRSCYELMQLATKYSQKFSDELNYTAEDREAYYAEHSDDFLGADLYAFETRIADFMEKDADGNPIGDAAEAVASVQETADKLAACKTADEFLAAIREYQVDVLGKTEEEAETIASNAFLSHYGTGSFGEEAADWMKAAKAGETYADTVKKDGDDVNTIDVYFLDKELYRDETKTRNVRHLLVSNEEYEDDTEAQRIYAEWEEADFSEDKLIELVGQYSHDTGSVNNGGLYEDVAAGDMVTEFNDWLFDESRQAGDHDIVETQYGWHLMYYVGEGELTGWETDANDKMTTRDYGDMVDKYSTSVVVNDKVVANIG